MDNEYAVKELVKKYFYDPTAFCRDILRVELDLWQKQAFKLLVDKHYVVIRSGSGVGKTFWESCATLWYLFTRPKSKVPTTAPSQHQLNDILWGEHFKRISGSPVLNKMMTWTQTRVGVKGYEPAWYAVARTAQVKPGSEVAEGLQGFHDEHYLMFVLDEASGISDSIFPAVEGALTHKDAYCILCGNPTRRSGYFYDTFNNPVISKMYAQMHVSCYDSSRVSERYIKMMEERYGRDHPVFLIKVLGEFPTADSELLIPPAFVETMQNNLQNDCRAFPFEFGVDIGRTGASSILCVRQGMNVVKWDEKHKPGSITDTGTQVRWISENIQEFDPQYVKIDAVGVGAGVYDDLKELWGDRIVPVIGNATPAEEFRDRYMNLRAQGYWELRNLIPYLYCKQWPERLITELSDIRTKPANKLKVESKDDMKMRALKSPDYADALYMAYLNADDCLHIKPVIYIFPSQIATTVDELKKPSFSDLSILTKPTFNKFQRAFHGRCN
jgi:hypothetical protein